MFAGYPPGDCFWRQSGEIWFHQVWKPFWDSLSVSQQQEYLDRWKVPNEWKNFYFNDDFQKWLASTDDN